MIASIGVEIEIECAMNLKSLDFNQLVSELIESGVSFPTAREQAVRELFGETQAELIKNSNDILGVEYVKGLMSINSDLDVTTIKRTGAKAVAYIWDDTFTYKQSNKIGYKIYRFFQRKSLKRVAKLTNKFFAISDLTKKEADEFFGIDSIILTKPLYRVPEVDYSNFEMPIKAVYAGNLFIGRDKSLARIIKAAERINNDGIKIKFDIYTSTELSDTIKEQLTCDYCEIHAAVPQEEVFEIQRNSDLMLFVEDIDGPDARIARLSFSTKITDYLSSGKCIFAVGYKETAPMQYFINNDVAVIATDDKEIEEKLSMLVNNPDLLVKYAENARDVGIRNHNEEKIISTFDNCIKSVI